MVYTSDPEPHSPELLARHGAFTRTGLQVEFEKLVELFDGQPIYDCSRSVGNAVIGLGETIVQVVTSQGSKTVISRDPENGMKKANHKPEPDWLRGIRKALMSLSEEGSEWARIEDKKRPARLFILDMQKNARAKREPEIVGYWPFDYNI